MEISELHVFCGTSQNAALRMPRTKGQKRKERDRLKRAAVVDSVYARYVDLNSRQVLGRAGSEADVEAEIRGSWLTFATLMWQYGPLVWQAIKWLAARWWAENKANT